MLLHLVDRGHCHTDGNRDAARRSTSPAGKFHLPELSEKRAKVAVAAVEVDLGHAQEIAGGEKWPKLIMKLATSSCEAWRVKSTAADGDLSDCGNHVVVDLIAEFRRDSEK